MRKKKEALSLPGMGGSALLTIFAVLCLTMLALLSVGTVQAERRLSEAAAESARAYYAADLEAQEIYARLRSGEAVPGVREEENRLMYTVSISQTQTLVVTLERRGEIWQVLRWQTLAHPEEPGETLTLWDGT